MPDIGVLDSSFVQVALALGVAVVIGAFTVALRQPLLIGFIIAGILVGPSALGFVGDVGQFELLAKLGISLLLFLVGLKLDPALVRTTGPVALATGLGQILFTSIAGFLIARALGYATVPALYIAVALTFSSTIIIVKLLSDKREIDELHGRIAVGFLIVQDIVVVLVMIVITAIGAAGDASVTERLVQVLLRGIVSLVVLAGLARWVLPSVFGRLSGNRELLVLASVAWAVALAAIADVLGFSSEVGAFLAGMTLAATPYREAIAARLVGLRDFLLLFFFIELGAQLDISAAVGQLLDASLLSVFVLVGNPLIVLVIMGAMRYRKRTSFLAGLTVAQISEFSLILVALGVRVGHIDQSVLGVVTAVGIITIVLSTYLILYSHQIFDRLAPFLSVFERAEPRSGDRPGHDEGDVDAIVYGLGRHGSLIAEGLSRSGWRVLGVDVDPQALRWGTSSGIEVIYGDAEDPEFVSALPLHQVIWVVSTVPTIETNLALLHALRSAGCEASVAMTAHTPEATRRLTDEGADLVLSPFSVMAERALDTILTASPEDAPR
jgi:Kef-type K+ transport system membrane component KefB